MAKSSPKAEARDFKGIVLTSDPHDLQPGTAQDQVNLKSDERGKATTRGGFLVVSFDSQS